MTGSQKPCSVLDFISCLVAMFRLFFEGLMQHLIPSILYLLMRLDQARDISSHAASSQ